MSSRTQPTGIGWAHDAPGPYNPVNAQAADADAINPGVQLSEVLQTLPPDTVRRTFWLPLSRGERAALRLTCRDLRAVICRACVRDLQLRVLLPPAGAPPVAAAAGAGAWPLATCRHRQRPAAPEPQPRLLHDLFPGTDSVTFRLSPSLDSNTGQLYNGGGGGRGGGGGSSMGPLPVAAMPAAAAAPGQQLPDDTLLHHFNTFRRPAVAGPANTPPSAASALATAGGGASKATSERASGGEAAVGRPGGGDGAAAAAGHMGFGAALPTMDQLLGIPATLDNGGGGGGGDGGEGVVALGVCPSVKVVRVLGLPYDLAAQSSYVSLLAAAYPRADTVVLRCTDSATSPPPPPPLLRSKSREAPSPSPQAGAPHLAPTPTPIAVAASTPEQLFFGLRGFESLWGGVEASPALPATATAGGAFNWTSVSGGGGGGGGGDCRGGGGGWVDYTAASSSIWSAGGDCTGGGSGGTGGGAAAIPALPWSDAIWNSVGAAAGGALFSGTGSGFGGCSRLAVPPPSLRPQLPPWGGIAPEEVVLEPALEAGSVEAVGAAPSQLEEDLVMSGMGHAALAPAPALLGPEDKPHVAAGRIDPVTVAEAADVKEEMGLAVEPTWEELQPPLEARAPMGGYPNPPTGTIPTALELPVQLFHNLHTVDFAVAGVSERRASAAPRALCFARAGAAAAAVAAPALRCLLAGPLARLRSLRLRGVVVTEEVLTAVVRLGTLTELRLRMVLPPPVSEAEVAAEVPCMVLLPGPLTALRGLRSLSVDLYGGSGRWLDAASVAAAELAVAAAAAARRMAASAATAGVAEVIDGGEYGGGGDGSVGAPSSSAAPPSQQRETWAHFAGGCCDNLTRLELQQVLLDAPLLQVLHRCTGLTALSALGLAARTFTKPGATPVPRLRLLSLRLADTRLGRGLLEALQMSPLLRHLALGLRLERFQMQLGKEARQLGSRRGGDAGGHEEGDLEHREQEAEGWRESFREAAAAGEAVAVAAAASAVRGAGAGRGGGAGSGGGGGVAGGGGCAWVELLRLCWRCEEVELAVCGALDWAAVAGWLAGALGRRLSCLALEANSRQWQVQDSALAAISYGLPYLRRLELLSYDITRHGLLRLAGMQSLRELRLDMQGFLAWMPPDYVLDLALAAAEGRRRAAMRRHGVDAAAVAGSPRHFTRRALRGAADLGSGGAEGESHDRWLVITATFLSEQQASDINERLRGAAAGDGGRGDGGGGVRCVWVGAGSAECEPDQVGDT